ncbi:tRNA N(3)-methylcytidine methyltransferase METTL6 [Chrysoperla carnea]|uniref:tRNA N(3)-methylcytidine methyltransferase METTL6 n=1 Tax=Chrysoperla carnea TaxID=189513 RepID=UPI001D05CF61|nr:tRNA N(3)-methylcytidine methyltransferase METTL6 [Chrysoperla carnea]XP_044729113.1 tRNA N(3)-methylcytidine methyltransferase METTL6 [Chrysoperla carnea]XP_044729114.1 tRNA N(3)-methylcytidine methyltransferase METTL6 [Chrysoperla carnea]
MDEITDDFNPTQDRILTESEIQKLQMQDTRLVSDFQANKLEIEAKKHWDLFYKRNENRFFKDRHWVTREFFELAELSDEKRVLLEIGCGVGNFIFPLIEDNINFFVYACDLSSKAIDLVKSNKLYDETRVIAFQTDITTEHILSVVALNSVDIVSLIFVLSAIHPEKFTATVSNIYKVLKPGGIVLFRDYALYDLAQIRFKPGHKIAENFYMRQDGTRSYYFSRDKLAEIFTNCGFEVIFNNYVQRRTVNAKEGIDMERLFIQAKFKKT